MKLHLVDNNADVALALQTAFKAHSEVQVVFGELLQLARVQKQNKPL